MSDPFSSSAAVEQKDCRTLLPSSANAGERAAEQTLARMTNLPAPLDALWRWDTCPAELLPWLAWALSVDTWSHDWPEAIKRQVIRESIRIHKRKGTVAAVRQALAAVHAEFELEEAQDGTHKFRAVVTPGNLLSLPPPGEPLFSPALIRDLDRVIRSTKPVRSSYALRLRPLSRTTLRPACGMTGQDRSQGTIRARQPRLTAKPALWVVAGGAAKSFGRAEAHMKPLGMTAKTSASVKAGAVVRERLSINFRRAA